MPTIEDYIEEIRPIFESRTLTNMGPVYKKFQKQLMEYLEVPELSLFVNGHMALELAIQALGLKKQGKALGGGEVITTPFTFVSTVHAITRNGLKPVFCDIRRSDYCMDPEKIEALITDKTVAIIPVHVYGNICDTEKIEKIADKHGLKVIYDGAHAFGEKYHGVGIGNFGDATMFSFHATKVFHSIEGGAIAFQDKRYGTPLHELKNFGIHGEVEISAIGGNAKLDEFRAAMGICNLRHVDAEIAKRGKVVARYRSHLKGVDGLKLNAIQPEVKPNHAYFPVVFEEEAFGASRNEVFAALAAAGIGARKYFHPLTNTFSAFHGAYDVSKTPVALHVSRRVLTLPLYADLAMADVDEICGIILGCRK